MTRKQNRFMTFLWSLIPGAGEMYLGFFKKGVSLMSLFALLMSVSVTLQLSYLSLFAPVVWFYSFFHTNNLASLPDDEFYGLEDDWLIHFSDLTENQKLLKKYRKLAAACLIVFGLSILWNCLYRLLFWYLLPALPVTEPFMEFLINLFRSVPQGAVAIAVIVAGILLIRNKSEEIREHQEG